MSTSKELADFVFDLSVKMNKAAELAYQPRCRDCGDVITDTAYNYRCYSCDQQLSREERQEWEQRQ